MHLFQRRNILKDGDDIHCTGRSKTVSKNSYKHFNDIFMKECKN